jgi:hypothetical protein
MYAAYGRRHRVAGPILLIGIWLVLTAGLFTLMTSNGAGDGLAALVALGVFGAVFFIWMASVLREQRLGLIVSFHVDRLDRIDGADN